MDVPYAGKKGQPNVTETIISTSWRHNQARRKICGVKYILIEDRFMKQELFLLLPKNWSGRHLVDIIGDISWTIEVTSRGHFW